MQTSYVFGEHRVPSFTLLDIAKKKSKSSAVQYNLHLSSSGEKKPTTKQKRGQESISRPAAQFKKKKKHPAIVSSCILDEKLQGLIVSGDILGPQDGQKYSQIQ